MLCLEGPSYFDSFGFNSSPLSTMQHPHAVMFPFTGQGHINPMIQLAKRLAANDFFVTFVTTEFDHSRMFNHAPSQQFSLHNIRFVKIPDGLPPDHGRLDQDVIELVQAIERLPEPFEMLMEEIMASDDRSPVSCIISDAFCSWMQDVANKFSIPRVAFWTAPVHANLMYSYQSLLISENIIPFKEKENATKLVTCIPGVVPLRATEVISFFQVEDSSDYLFQWFLNLGMKRPREALWNLGNNVYELESRAIDAFRKEVESFLPVGPLLPSAFLGTSSNELEGMSGPSLWPEDKSCKQWLDSQKPCSVLYISFGSVVGISERQLEELALGVEASQQPFLWAMRLESQSPIFQGFQERTRGRGLVVSWAPQLLILSHPSVAGFLTHCGWNSVTESMCRGVPILAMPGGFAEQKMNARYVVDEWKVGMELRSGRADGFVEAEEVERGIRALMGGSEDAEEVRLGVGRVRAMAREATMEGGLSHRNLEMFVQDMRRRAADLQAAKAT